jgi:hypothetical protein
MQITERLQSIGKRLLRLSLLLLGGLFAYVLSLWLLTLITGGRYKTVLAVLAIAGPFMVFRNTWHRWRAARAFRRMYGKSGKDLLIVLTDSPHWKPYILGEWLPRWGDRAVILNRSQPWRKDSPEALLWNAVKGAQEHTPLAVVVPRRGSVRVIPFFKAFMGYKHGRDPDLRRQEEILARALSS